MNTPDISAQPSINSSAERVFEPSRPAFIDMAGQWRPALALTANTIRRSLFQKRALALAILALLPVALAVVWRVIIYKFSNEMDPNGYPERFFMAAVNLYGMIMGTFHAWFIWPLVALWAGTAAVRDEIEEETITYLLLRPLSKLTFTAAKVIAVTLVSWIIIASSTVLVYLILATKTDSGLFPGEIPILIRDLLVALLACWAYVGIFAFIGAYFKRPYLIGIVLVFIWDGFVAFLPGRGHFFTVKYYIKALFSHELSIPMGHSQEFQDLLKLLGPGDSISSAAAISALLAIGILGTLAAIVVVYRREYLLEQAGS